MSWLKRRHRNRLMSKRFPTEWLSFIQRNVPFYKCLPPGDQSKLQRLIQIFLDEKKFEGCGGLEINDDIRVTIAAQACILLLGGTSDFIPNSFRL